MRPATRIVAIDRYRGALVWLMVAGNHLGGVEAVPDVIKHTPDIGLSVADLVAPAFVFAMGLGYGDSFRRRRLADGAGAAYRHFLLRYLALLGIGALLSAGGTVVGQPSTWGVLQALGEAGLVALLVIRFGIAVRLAAGIALLIGYQLVLDHGGLGSVLTTVQGGFLGGLSWGALLILSTAVADLWRRHGLAALAVASGVAAAVAIISLLVVPISKNRVSLSYVLVTLAVAAVAFLLTVLGSRLVRDRPGYLAWWGENPLVLYLAHLLLLALVVLPPAEWWYAGAPLWLAAVQLVAIMTIMSLIAWWLHRRRMLVEL